MFFIDERSFILTDGLILDDYLFVFDSDFGALLKKRHQMLSKLFTLSLVLFSLSSFAQHGVCGLPGGHEDEILIERLKANKRIVESGAFQRSGNTRYVGVIFHDIRKNDNSGAIAASRIYDLMCSMNEFYATQDVGIQFYLEDINVIVNSNAYSDHTGAGFGVLNGARVAGFANVYIPENANPDGLSPGGNVLGYYSPSDDWMVMRPGEINGFSTTLNHEMGHYLSLPHPFRGWDFEYYDEDVHGTQVGTFAPSVGFNQNIRNEMEDGSNCSFAGDLICDTKPDYAPYNDAWGCNYSGGVMDPNGDEINPDETNVMSYFGCSPETFTDGQIDVMNADLTARLGFSGQRRLNTINPPSTSVGDFVDIITPQENEIVDNNANILFDWEDVDNATSYLFEIDRIPSFVLAPQRYSSTESEFNYEDDNLILGLKYYWRVKPADGYDLCKDWSPTFSFIASSISSVNTISGVSEFSVFPNPAQESSSVNLSLSANENFKASLEIVSISGIQVEAVEIIDFRNGNNTYELNTANLSAGVYFLKVVSEKGTIQEKFVIQ